MTIILAIALIVGLSIATKGIALFVILLGIIAGLVIFLLWMLAAIMAEALGDKD